MYCAHFKMCCLLCGGRPQSFSSALQQVGCPVHSFFPGEQRRCLQEVATRSAAHGGCRGVVVVVVGWAEGDHQRKGVGVGWGVGGCMLIF